MAAAGVHQDDESIKEQTRTFSGFMDVTVWSSAIVSMAVLFLTLVFAVGFPWLGSLVGSVAAGALAGAALGRGAAWYGVMIGVFVLGLIGGVVFEIVRSFSA